MIADLDQAQRGRDLPAINLGCDLGLISPRHVPSWGVLSALATGELVNVTWILNKNVFVFSLVFFGFGRKRFFRVFFSRPGKTM